MRIFIFFIFSFSTLLLNNDPLIAQEITGLWRGSFEAGGSDIAYELFVIQEGEKFIGYGMSTLLIEGIENMAIKEVNVRMKKGDVYFEDGELVFSNFSKPGKRVVFTASLNLRQTGTESIMEGKYRTRSLDLRDRSFYAGNIQLKKVNEKAEDKLMAKLTEMKLPRKEHISIVATVLTTKENENTPAKAIVTNTRSSKQEEMVKIEETKNELKVPTPAATLPPAYFLSSRTQDIIHTYTFNGDSIILDFYDNGTVDGDTITVLLNDKIIIAKKLLSLTSLRERIVIPSGTDSMRLTMYAESLGEFPPNTGILVLQDGKTRNEIRFTGDTNRSSAIMLRRKK